MNKRLVAVLSIIAFLVVAGAVAAFVSQPQPTASVQRQSLTPTPSVVPLVIEASSSSLDTANPVFVSNTYKTEGTLPLNTWQPITVYGETFPACAVGHDGTQTVLTVDADNSQICGDITHSPKGE